MLPIRERDCEEQHIFRINSNGIQYEAKVWAGTIREGGDVILNPVIRELTGQDLAPIGYIAVIFTVRKNNQILCAQAFRHEGYFRLADRTLIPVDEWFLKNGKRVLEEIVRRHENNTHVQDDRARIIEMAP